MKLSVTDNARKWFEEEVTIPENYGIRFLGKSTARQKYMMVFLSECLSNSLNDQSKKKPLTGCCFLLKKQMTGFSRGMILLLIMMHL